MADPGKGSKRRPGDLKSFGENYDKIFKNRKTSSTGRKVYKQVKNPDGTYSFIEMENPPPRLSEDLMFQGTFVSPVDGSIIRSKRQLVDHNKRNGVMQAVPGVHEDVMTAQKENMEESFGESAKKERIEAVKAALDKS